MIKTPSPPFYVFSSRNKRGNRPHPKTFAKREAILMMYWEHRTMAQIAAELEISLDSVRDHIRRARASGDERAARTTGIKRLINAQVRRDAVVRLAAQGMAASEIAAHLNVTPRLVQRRAKEAGVVFGGVTVHRRTSPLIVQRFFQILQDTAKANWRRYVSDNPGKIALTVGEVCEAVSISRATLFKEVSAGRLKAKYLGRKLLIERREIEKWLAGLPTHGPRSVAARAVC